MIGLLVIGLVVALVVRDDGDDDTTATTLPLIGTSEPSSTIAATSTTITLEPSTSSTAPTTAAATTVPATTPPTTVATTTTTVVPTTTTTAAPVPALPDPGFAVVDGQTVQIARSCLVVPLEPATADLQVVSHLLPTIDGRLVLDRFSDGGSNGLDGTFVDTGTALQATVLDGGPLRGPFTATLRPADGGPDVDVAVNPDPGRSVDCLDTIRTRDADDSERSQYTHAILDVCTVRPDDDRLDVAGIGSDGARFTVDDNGDGTVELRFTDRRVGDLTDPDATASFDESIAFYEGVVSGGGDELVVRIEVELAAPRSCSPTEAP